MNTIHPTLQDLPDVLQSHIGTFVETPLAYLRTSKQISKQAGSMLNRKDTLVSELLQYHGMAQQMQKGYFGTTWQSSIKELDLDGVFIRENTKAYKYNDKLLQTIIATFPHLQKLQIGAGISHYLPVSGVRFERDKIGFFSEKSIKKLETLLHLEELDISGVKIKDDKFVHNIAQIKTLKKLTLLNVTYKQLSNLKNLPKLEELRIENNISPRSLPYIGNNFKTLKKLVCLYHYNPKMMAENKFSHLTITEASIEHLKEADKKRNKRVQKMFLWPDKRVLPAESSIRKNIFYPDWNFFLIFIERCIQCVIFAVQSTRAKLTRLIGTTVEQTG